MKHFESYIKKNRNAGMKYLARNLDKRADPSLLVEGACTVLCFLAPYDGHSGKIASFAYGKDYHPVIKGKLHKIALHILQECDKLGLPPFKYRVFVDSAPVLERFWAACAGLGFIGLNNFLISPEFGLRTLIGTIICNLPEEHFEEHPPLSVHECGSCGRCIVNCPSGALAPHSLDARKCISYHTIESKELYDSRPVDFAGNYFGCDCCLNACPWNKDIKGWEEFSQNRKVIDGLTGDDWKKMSEDEFDTLFNDSPLQRAGLRKIKNNI